MLLGTHTYKHLHTHMHIHTWGYFTYIMPSNNYDCNRNYARMLCDSAYDYTSQFMFLKSMSPSRAAGVKAGSVAQGRDQGPAPLLASRRRLREASLGRSDEGGARSLAATHLGTRQPPPAFGVRRTRTHPAPVNRPPPRPRHGRANPACPYPIPPPCYAMLCCAALCYAMQCYAMLLCYGESPGGDWGNRLEDTGGTTRGASKKNLGSCFAYVLSEAPGPPRSPRLGAASFRGAGKRTRRNIRRNS